MSRQAFLQVNKLPASCGFSQSDWELLASFWHPIARSQDVGEEPIEIRLLDKSLVVYKTASGITVADNYCPHRGAKLSLGTVENDRLVCAYHGLPFDGTGVCTGVPCMGDRVPETFQMNLTLYSTVERYGLVWVCLRSLARIPLPECAAMESDAFEVFTMAPELWNCSALRHCENFNDTAHIPFVHDTTFGHKTAPEIPAYKVSETEEGILRSVTMQIDPRIDQEQPKSQACEATFNYSYTFPFTSILEIMMPSALGSDFIMDVVSPVSTRQSRIFQVKARSFARGKSKTPAIAVYQASVNSEDRPIVESQFPQKVPLDPRAEKHISADRWSIVYRKRWRALGLDVTPKEQ